MNTQHGATAAHYAVGVVGLGDSGRSVIEHLAGGEDSLIAFDTRAEPPALADVRTLAPALEVVTGALDADLLTRCQTLVVSPGVPLDTPAIAAAAAAGTAIIGDVELFARRATAPVVAITGTNGKSTVTCLVAEMLSAAGCEVRAGGNLGPPALELLGADEPDAYVLELSSFQLDLVHTLSPRVACVLNVVPDHLDRHHGFEAYAASKARIFARADVAVVNADDEVVSNFACPGRRVEFSLGPPGPARYGVVEAGGESWLALGSERILPADAVPLAGRHNLANALAALAICDAFGAPRAGALDGLRRFRGLPHRAQTVAVVDGVTYVNDSKATNPGAAEAALGALVAPGRGVLIAGGDGKGADFTSLGAVIEQRAHTLVLIGAAADAIAAAVGSGTAVVRAADMDQAVRAAAAAARTGDVVLLAPACASFDMFDGYAARGAAFAAAVAALEAR
ncbi:MAG: UDP-N-acetylmuramoyl-L-alanine--D-glutamate ligase [Gammaproteobacteria bacterium]